MERHPEHGLPHDDWRSEGSTHEKQAHAQNPKTSKRRIWRLFRLGAALVLTTAALVLTLIILVAGRHGDGSSDLALITIDLSDFAHFDAPTINLVNSTNSTTESSKTRRGLGSWASDVASAAGSIETAVETAVSGAASAVETAAQAVATAAEAEADKIIDDIGDDLTDIEDAVIGLMDKILGTIQDELNKWLSETTSALDSLDIPDKMSLHLTTYCSTKSTSGSNSTQTSCDQLFSSGGASSFNATANNGTVFGFQPGGVIAKVLGVFYVPESAQQDIREPVDNAANSVEKLIQEAGNDLSSWSVDLLFTPIVVIYALACAFMCLLLLLLIAATAYSLRESEGLPPRVYSVYGTIAALATFFLFLGSLILTIVALVAHIVDLAVGVVDISISSGSKLKWLSWTAFILMALLTGTFKVEEFVAECIFWWRFITKLLRVGRSKGGVRDLMRSL